MLDFDHFAFHTSVLPGDDSEKKEFFKKLEVQFQEEIKNSELAQEYFSEYNPVNVDQFIKSYSSRKVHLTQCYKFYADEYHHKEISELNFQAKAEQALGLILHKKLFDMQLLWRAGKLEIEDIKTSYDFSFWGKHILSCPFIPLVEKKEVELMKGYLAQESEEFDPYLNWQNYDEITEKNIEGLMDELPEWYQFYDLRMNTGTLLTLPNYKGEKETYYMNLSHGESISRILPKTYPPQQPILYAGYEEMCNFCKYFETDKYFLALFKYYKYHYEKEFRRPNYDDVTIAVDLLFKADRPVYFNPTLNWDEAIVAAANEYTNTKIAEMLDFVYEQYLMMKELGFSDRETPIELEDALAKDFIVSLYRTSILKGRKLNGETENFDY